MENTYSEQEFLPQVNESMADYLKSERYLNTFKEITISSLEEQEESRRWFSALITPLQRMELLNIMIRSVFADELTQPQEVLWNNEIIFTKP